jgi:hypothetical protein
MDAFSPAICLQSPFAESAIYNMASSSAAITDIVVYTPPLTAANFPDLPSEASARGRGFLFTIAAPKDPLPTEAARRGAGCLLPSDVGKEGAVNLLKSAFGPGNPVKAAVAVMELHQRRAPWMDGDSHGTGFYPRLHHIHVAGLATKPFAHKKIAALVQSMNGGMRGHFSIGSFEAKALYLLQPSSMKSSLDLDANPLFWGDVGPDDFLVDGDDPPAKRAKAASVNDLTAAILEHRLVSVADVKAHAKAEYLSGTEAGAKYYKYVLSLPALPTKVNEILELFGLRKCKTAMYSVGGTYPLSSFQWQDDTLDAWLNGLWRERTLVLSGMAGAGKSRFALAAALSITGGPVLFARTFEEVRDADDGWNALVLDEMASILDAWVQAKKLDSIKNVLDVELASSWPCRMQDARVPAGQPRILVVQRGLEHICKPYVSCLDWEAIERRSTSVNVTASLLKAHEYTKQTQDL